MEQKNHSLDYEGRWILFKHYLASLAIRNLCSKADNENEYNQIFAINDILKELKAEMDRLDSIGSWEEELKKYL